MSRENVFFFFFFLLLLLPISELHFLFAQDKLSTLYQELEKKYAKITQGDVEAYHELAHWCREKKLRQREQKIYSAILQFDPENEKAHQKLGHYFKSGVWYPNESLWRESQGEIRRLREWVHAEQKESSWVLLHDYWLTPKELQQIQEGDSLLAHESNEEREILTQHYHFWSALKIKESLELGRILEQAFRQWQQESFSSVSTPFPVPLKIHILKNHSAFLKMIEDDIETFPEYLKKAHGYFDGEWCILSYFHDAYRTRQILIHEGRHQYDALVSQIYFRLPKWYAEGIAEYYAHHRWEKQQLSMGALNPSENYSLYFVGKWLTQNKIRPIENFLLQPTQSEIDASWYHNVWALIYYLKNSSYASGFKHWEQALYEGKFSSAEDQHQQFLEKVTSNLKEFHQRYKKQLEVWSRLAPKKF